MTYATRKTTASSKTERERAADQVVRRMRHLTKVAEAEAEIGMAKRRLAEAVKAAVKAGCSTEEIAAAKRLARPS